jgi:hypothetical protein
MTGIIFRIATGVRFNTINRVDHAVRSKPAGLPFFMSHGEPL